MKLVINENMSVENKDVRVKARALRRSTISKGIRKLSTN